VNSRDIIEESGKPKTKLLALTDMLVEALVVTLLISIFVSRFVRTPNWLVRFAIVAPVVVAFLRKPSPPATLKQP
jgi:hypothetical protein